MVSPSTRKFMRNTPWVEGCCGPMLTMNWSVSSCVTSAPLGSKNLPLVSSPGSSVFQPLYSLGTLKLVPWGLNSSARKCWPSSTRLS